jgi:hypothetical protein
MARQKVTNIQQFHRVTSRPGEGTSVGFVLKHSSNTDGTAVVKLQLNLNTARVPDRRYVANSAAVVQEGDRLTLIFGQTKLGGGGYRSLLLLELSSTYARQFIQASAAMLKTAIQYAEKHGVPRAKLAEIREDVPGQTVPFAANIATAGFTGRDACMDYYYASPFSVQIAGQGGEFQADPVVRVNLPTGLMIAIYERLFELKNSLPRESSDSEEDNDDSAV